MDLKAIYEYIEISVTLIVAIGMVWRVAVFMQQAKVALTSDIPRIKSEMEDQTKALHAQTVLLSEIRDKL
jgi:hypothetical protein